MDDRPSWDITVDIPSVQYPPTKSLRFLDTRKDGLILGPQRLDLPWILV
jgi:hypothetical protein